jgi:hypothetical protein
MSLWTLGAASMFVSVIAIGCLILIDFSNYRKYHARPILALLAWYTFLLLSCGTFMIYDAGKASGAW